MDRGIEARIAALEAELADLRQQVGGRPDDGPATSDRRGMLRLVAAGAVGALTGTAALRAQPVAAADGAAVLQGLPNDGTAVTGLSASGDAALSAFGSPWGVESDGTYANAYFPGSGPPPSGPGGVIGAMYVDGDGNWWASVVDVDPTVGSGVWRKMAGPTTAGQLHVLPVPIRVYDSRPGLAPVNVGAKSPTVGNTGRVVDTTANGSGVPMSANAVLITLTITAPRTAGFATAWPSGQAWPGTSNINFAAGQDIATTTVVGCGVGASILVQSNTVTDFLVDVVGYYQ